MLRTGSGAEEGALGWGLQENRRAAGGNVKRMIADGDKSVGGEEDSKQDVWGYLVYTAGEGGSPRKTSIVKNSFSASLDLGFMKIHLPVMKKLKSPAINQLSVKSEDEGLVAFTMLVIIIFSIRVKDEEEAQTHFFSFPQGAYPETMTSVTGMIIIAIIKVSKFDRLPGAVYQRPLGAGFFAVKSIRLPCSGFAVEVD
ncbi:hypothetical protein E5288_WYG020267 [Bos mutus]|uniref:Uncharacterized protein n=1 Tax=Bos mutus TaxID=72004 RepID=A0A6B0S0W2_9CETA|nr:hypothetical protein [Bos mutus]